MSAPKRRPLRIKGADDKPIEIAPGDWYQRPKGRPKRMSKNSLSVKGRRVYEALEPATMGWQREDAVIRGENGKLRHLTSADLVRITGMDKQDVRYGLAECEQQKLVKRVAKDGGALRKNRVIIYSFAVPPSEPEPEIVGARAYHFAPSWLAERPKTDPLKACVNRWKISFPDGLVLARESIEALDQAAREYKTAESDLRAVLERVGAEPLYIRKKQLLNNSLNNGGAAAAGVSVVSKAIPSSSSSSSEPTTTTTAIANKKAPPDPLPESVWQFAGKNTGRKSFSREEVNEYWNQCQKLARDRGPLSAEDVLAIMQQTANDAAEPIESFRYFVKAAPKQVAAYLDHRGESAAMAAGGRVSDYDRIMQELEAED